MVDVVKLDTHFLTLAMMSERRGEVVPDDSPDSWADTEVGADAGESGGGERGEPSSVSREQRYCHTAVVDEACRQRTALLRVRRTRAAKGAVSIHITWGG